jgi:hypothetical protein
MTGTSACVGGARLADRWGAGGNRVCQSATPRDARRLPPTRPSSREEESQPLVGKWALAQSSWEFPPDGTRLGCNDVPPRRREGFAGAVPCDH